MAALNVRPMVLLLAGGAVLAAVVVVGRNPQAAGQTVGAAVVDMADGVVSGAIFEIGDKVGLPNTSEQSTVAQGRAELAAGDLWNASFHLPAGEFIAGAWDYLTK